MNWRLDNGTERTFGAFEPPVRWASICENLSVKELIFLRWKGQSTIYLSFEYI
jgi:hypothetical protein